MVLEIRLHSTNHLSKFINHPYFMRFSFLRPASPPTKATNPAWRDQTALAIAKAVHHSQYSEPNMFVPLKPSVEPSPSSECAFDRLGSDIWAIILDHLRPIPVKAGSGVASTEGLGGLPQEGIDALLRARGHVTERRDIRATDLATLMRTSVVSISSPTSFILYITRPTSSFTELEVLISRSVSTSLRQSLSIALSIRMIYQLSYIISSNPSLILSPWNPQVSITMSSSPLIPTFAVKLSS